MPLLIFKCEPSQNAGLLTLHSVCGLFDGFQAAVGGPEIPLFQKGFGKTKKKEEYHEIQYKGPGGRHVSPNEG